MAFMNHHVFICHATEDKESLAQPLTERLRERGVLVWYDQFSMSIGESLRESIDRGLAACTYGVVILSPSFFQKQWTQRELNGLVAREMIEQRKIILPIWHGVDREEIARHSPPLADVFGIKYNGDLDAVVNCIFEKIRGSDPYIQFGGRHHVRILDNKGLQAKIITEKTVQVGKEPLSHMDVRISATGEVTLERLAPGKSEGVKHDGGAEMLRIAYTPPIPPGTIFTQTMIYDAPNLFDDPENIVNVIPVLPYEYFVLSVEVPMPNLIKNVKAFKTVGKTDFTLPQIVLNEKGTEYSIRLIRPEVGYRHTLAWTW
jgi:hypothetical protein